MFSLCAVKNYKFSFKSIIANLLIILFESSKIFVYSNLTVSEKCVLMSSVIIDLLGFFLMYFNLTVTYLKVHGSYTSWWIFSFSVLLFCTLFCLTGTSASLHF